MQILLLVGQTLLHTKWDSFNACIIKTGKCYYKVGQVVIQIRADIAKQGNIYCKVGQLLQSTKGKREKRGKTIDYGNVILYSPLICHVTDNLPLGISEKLNLCQNQKKEKVPHHRSRICVTCKLEKQSLRDISCTENCFCLTLSNSLENNQLRRVLTVKFTVNGLIIITSKLHSTKSELKFCAGSNPD